MKTNLTCEYVAPVLLWLRKKQVKCGVMAIAVVRFGGISMSFCRHHAQVCGLL